MEKNKLPNAQSSFKFSDCLNFGNFDLMKRICKCKNEREVQSLLTAFKENGYNRVAFAKN